jgi:hypothetical protein
MKIVIVAGAINTEMVCRHQSRRWVMSSSFLQPVLKKTLRLRFGIGQRLLN